MEGDILFLVQIPLASALAWQVLVCTIYYQIFMDIWLGHNKELIFFFFDLIFKVTAIEKTENLGWLGTFVVSESIFTS